MALLFPFFLLSQGLTPKVIALILFAVAAATDYLDGYFARKEGSGTHFGRLMDPIADKILTLSAFISFAFIRLIPAWMVILIAARDLLVTGARLRSPIQSTETSPRASGKRKTFLQMTVILTTLLYLALRETAAWNPGWNETAQRSLFYLFAAVVAITLWSGLRFLLKK